MDGKMVISKKTRRERNLHGVKRKIGVYERKQAKGKGNYSAEISILAKQVEILNSRLAS